MPVFLLALSVSVCAQSKPRVRRSQAKPAPVSVSVKIAEGKYRLVGEKAPMAFEESWSLFKTPLGYRLEAQWAVTQPGGAQPNIIDTRIEMVAGLRPTELQIGLDPRQSLHCRFTVNQLLCEAQGRQATLPMQGAYDFFSPSPWMLGNIVRRARKDVAAPLNIQLARIKDTNPAGLGLDSFMAQAQFVGDDQIEIGGKRFAASIYELRAEGKIPSMLVWTSPEGIVLAMQDSSRPDQRMELVEFKVHGKI